jgi:glycosyltransferase involved in cell wall biosynthesis
MVKHVLMIAFNYPPQRGSSGIQRTLAFTKHLSVFGWTPVVLTASTRAYPDTSPDLLADIPQQVAVHRPFAFDTSRHLAIKGRYLGALALPDRWVSWWLGAVPRGMGLIRKYRPQVLWSTYPIATAHLIALTLHRLTGIPWVADLRDPMTDDVHPSHPLTRRVYRWLEKKTISHCTKAVCTTPGAVRLYRERYPDIPASRFALIENGYDEDSFLKVESQSSCDHTMPRPFVLLHSGAIYPSERDPSVFFQALQELVRSGQVAPENLKVLLRATEHDSHLTALIRQYGIEALVSLAPPLPYRAALAEMLSADGLLILQASNCNNQIPAKLYEYLRARRPILALTDIDGDTAGALRNAGIETIAPLDSKDDIKRELVRFLSLTANMKAHLPPRELVESHSRHSRAGELGQLLDHIVAAEKDFHPARDKTA